MSRYMTFQQLPLISLGGVSTFFALCLYGTGVLMRSPWWEQTVIYSSEHVFTIAVNNSKSEKMQWLR